MCQTPELHISPLVPCDSMNTPEFPHRGIGVWGIGRRGIEIWGRGGVEAGPGNDVFLEKPWSADWIEQPDWRHLDSFSAKVSDMSSNRNYRIMISACQQK